MRAILILICLLNQFTIVECGTLPPDPKCGKLYDCFVPTKCIDGSTPVLNSDVEPLNHKVHIQDDCPALFRFHLYLNNWADVSIESFNPSILSIAFKLHLMDSSTTIEFSCNSINEQFVGKYNDEIKVTTVKAKNLKCTFEVKLKSTSLVFGDINNVKMQFKVDNKETNKDQIFHTPQTKCDPSDLQYDEDNSNAKEIFAKVQHILGEYSCKDEGLFKLQYKTDVTDYISVDSLICDNNYKFNIFSGKPAPDIIPKSDPVFIRCKAEAQYFCNYPPDVMHKMPDGNQKPNFTNSDIQSQKPSKLWCPSTHPHLVIDGMGKPVPNAKFECKHLGHRNTFWTVRFDNDDIILAEGKRQVSCTNKLDCQQMVKIRQSSIKKGRLDEHGLPMCFPGQNGTLEVNGQEVTGKRCNTHTGKFQYTVGIAEPKTYNDIEIDTKFTCKYPDKYDDKQNEADNKVKLGGQIGSVVFVVIGGIVIIIVIIWCSSHRIKKRKKRIEELEKEAMKGEDTAWKKYAMTKGELKKIKEERQKLLEEKKKEMEEKGLVMEENPEEEQSPSSAQLGRVYEWGRMAMAFIRATLKYIWTGINFPSDDNLDDLKTVENAATKNRDVCTIETKYISLEDKNKDIRKKWQNDSESELRTFKLTMKEEDRKAAEKK